MARKTVTTITARTQPPSDLTTPYSIPGKFAQMPVKMRIDMPLPTPRSVMSSASHMIRPVPAVMARTAMAYFMGEAAGMIWDLQSRNSVVLAREMNTEDCRRASPIVT